MQNFFKTCSVLSSNQAFSNLVSFFPTSSQINLHEWEMYFFSNVCRNHYFSSNLELQSNLLLASCSDSWFLKNLPAAIPTKLTCSVPTGAKIDQL